MEILLSTFTPLFGLIIGSFLNCLIWRLYKEETLWGRSYCPKCKKQIDWFDNIPVLSFLLLRGKCRGCQKSISWQYPVVELVTALLFAFASYKLWVMGYSANSQAISQFLNFSISNPLITNYLFLITLIKYWFLISVMIVIFIIDLRWYLILDIVTLPAVIVIAIINGFLGFDLLNLLISGIIGGSFFFLQYIVSRGKWIGGGDIRLGLLMGVALGWPQVILAIMLAYFLGSIVAIALVASGKKAWGSKLPLGVFLSTATVICLFWGERILDWYLDIVSF